MRIFRHRTVRSCLITLIGLTFLNLSFLIAEVAALKNAYDRTVLENIARMISASMAEEETDMASSTENGPSLKEIDLLGANLHHLNFEEQGIACTLKALKCQLETHPGYRQFFSPPPDSLVG